MDQADAGDERRSEERMITLLRVGKILIDDREELCVIRNLSASGLMAHTRAGHAVGDRIEVELKADTRMAGEIVWVRGQTIGVKFDGLVEVRSILAHRPGPSGHMPRAPRVEVSGNARIDAQGVACPAALRDISQGGVKIIIAERLVIDRKVEVAIEDLPTFEGVVRWCHDGHAGISFVRPIPFDALTDWLHTRSAGV